MEIVCRRFVIYNMNSRRGSGKQTFAGPNNSKGKYISPHGHSSGYPDVTNTNIRVDQLSHDMTQTTLDSEKDAGDWQIKLKNQKKKTGGVIIQGVAPNSTPNARDHQNGKQKLGMNGNVGPRKPTECAWQTQGAGRGTANPQPYNRRPNNIFNAPPTSVAPPLQQGWQWNARAGGGDFGSDTDHWQNQSDVEDVEDDEDDLVEDDDDDLMSDDFDSDGSVKSHKTRKTHKWFKSFFEVLDKLTIEELNEPSRQWHCPACRNGPGAIDWYRGLQPLIAHAKTKGSKRVWFHRELAELLDEELIRRGAAVSSSGEVFGKWEGLHEAVADREILWPPMVVVLNTVLELDEYDQKWIGMGNQELLDCFSSYDKAMRARHAYGPKGHRGISVLIFEGSAVGYLDAERLHKDFTNQGTDRYAWDKHRVTHKSGGKRQLYGYMARKEDLDSFNKHCQGKQKLKFEIKSYQEMVVVPLRQMSEDNQQLVWLKNKVVKEQKHSKALEESFGVMSQKLRKTMEENRIVRQRTKMQHEQNKEEMDQQEQFFKDQIDIIHRALEDKERAFEELLQDERKKKQSTADSRAQYKNKLKQKEIADFIQIQVKSIEEFEREREQLIKMHQNKKAEMKRRHMEEEIDLEKEFECSLTWLMKKYTPPSSEEVNTSTSSSDTGRLYQTSNKHI